MALSQAVFLAQFPEFGNAPPGLVERALDEAALMVDSAVYGTKTNVALGYYAAHLIAINPLGELARLQKDPEKTTYMLAFQRIQRSLGAGFRTI